MYHMHIVFKTRPCLATILMLTLFGIFYIIHLFYIFNLISMYRNLILRKRFVVDQEINLSDAWADAHNSVAFTMWELCIEQQLVFHNQPTDSSDENAWCQLHRASTPFPLLRCVSEDTDHFHKQTHQLDRRYSTSFAKVCSPRGL